ncbi:type I-E CRISPR-associated protein Cse1/CasA [Streptomyces kunmingensis]|uniref:Type I-E CRISPR-associated protein Cse1/CasA n=1 Tax=Streptomyces kunmingensis TaxID=68225 RepID=A0ABU6CNU4_9ACTN|nr:type I-E CRISPR-associated protein Cse1/CasA [Streptomyces kunmingensis]MEB3966348.1 type I-E CRISPR-associated protein Cse1/CasA [Streptomyces kunmingensis]
MTAGTEKGDGLSLPAPRISWDPRKNECVPVVRIDSSYDKVTLVEALREADDLAEVAGSTPGETVALLEYLLAILYSLGAQPEDSRQWVEHVASERSFVEFADRLEQCCDKTAAQGCEHWDLFHPTAPLGQNALLAPYLEEYGAGPAQLVIERVGDYHQFFDHHHLEHSTPLPADAAFRAMLTQHAYGPGGRARIAGRATLGPALTNLARGRLAGRIRVLALGQTLGDTLRLNLIPCAKNALGSDHFNRTWTVSPEPRRTFTTKPPGRTPAGPADLHSVLGRSVLLRPAVTASGDIVVDRVLLAAGELLEELDPHHIPDAVYAVSGKNGEVRPIRATEAKEFWREAHALYAAVADRQVVPGGRPGSAAGLYDRIARLPGRHLRLMAVGLITRQTTVVSWVCDTFPFVPGREQDLRYAAERGSALAEYVAGALSKAAYAAWTVAYTNPKPADKKDQIARFDAGREHWAHTAEHFHTLLDKTIAAADDEKRLDAALLEYAAELAAAARRFLLHRLDSLPANAQGNRARARALHRLKFLLHEDTKAPLELAKGDQS